MSFSSDTKAELCRRQVKNKTAAEAECYGALLFCHTFSAETIRVITSSAEFATRMRKLLHRAFGLNLSGRPSESGRHSIVITDKNDIREVFRAFGMEPHETIALHVNLGVLEEDSSRSAFVRGAFLAGGSISDPEKSYHLEMCTTHMSVARECCAMLREMGAEPRLTARGAQSVIYFKQPDKIADFLTAIGAPAAALGIVSAKVNKDMRNEINRKVNCDSANADKTVEAAGSQLDTIRKLEREKGLGSLPDKLREAALLRIANPSASLADLAQLAIPPVSKSCINHRLKKIAELAEEE